MSSIARSRVLVIACLSLACCCGDVLAGDDPRELSCHGDGAESAALKQAPSGARRLQEHVLEVAFRNGSQRFVDKPPHEPLGGIHWRYCGYESQAKAHLIQRSDEGLLSGDIFFDETGRLMRAGHTVLFSPDRQALLAIEQEDGMDGELWSVYDIAGKAKWKGYAGTSEKRDGVDMVVSTFERPEWNRHGELTARYVCTASPANGMVTLRHSPSGGWEWQGHAGC